MSDSVYTHKPSQIFPFPYQSIIQQHNPSKLYLLINNVCQAYLKYQQGIALQAKKNDPDFSILINTIMGHFVQTQIQLWSNPQNLHTIYNSILSSSYKYWNTESGAQNNAITDKKQNDKRFQDFEWSSNPTFDFVKKCYESNVANILSAISNINNSHSIDDSENNIQNAEFFLNQIINIICPTNAIMTNPQVIRETMETNGVNLLKGAENFLDDVKKSRSLFRMCSVDESAFEIGKNIAATPGKVVFQNELFQLIQYAASTAEVQETPVLIIPAWINKYYILDLSPHNSFVKWLVDSGHTIFMISWVNPDASYAHTTFEDYLINGILNAIEKVLSITKQSQLNCIGYCLGGTLLAIATAYLAEKKLDYIRSATFLTAMFDFKDCGIIRAFINDNILQALERYMEKKGYLDGDIFYTTFSFLRPNDMIWPFFINNYLLGKKPTAFDILFWNADSMNLPKEMHSYYLRNFYYKNSLCKPGELEIGGVKIDLSKITVPLYFLATESDHIAPWKAVYKGLQLCSSSKVKRFVLAKSGHVAGVINHPSQNKYGYYVGDIKSICNDPSLWKDSAVEKTGSWWAEWNNWHIEHALESKKVPAKKIQEDLIIEDAPGSYVNMKI